MRLCFLSTQGFSIPTLEAIVRQGNHDVVVCSIPRNMAEMAKVMGYGDFQGVAERLGISYRDVHTFDLSSPEDKAYFETERFDGVLALGWNRLVPDSIIRSARLGVIGSHTSPNELPLGRGRSPVVWSIVLGFSRVTSHLFKIDSGVDTGRILSSYVLPVGPEDTTQILYYKICLAHARMLDEALENLSQGDGWGQSGLPDLVFPKRGPKDAVIDWGSSAARIHDLVRAVTRPFHGAFFSMDDKVFHLWKARLWDGPDPGGRPGEVMAVFPDGAAVVATGQGHLLLLEHDCPALRAGTVLT